jgi:hypothetical protein
MPFGAEIKHGMSYHPAYGSWKNLRRRYSNPKDAEWKHYGGRGISVCERWNESFEAFEPLGKKGSK